MRQLSFLTENIGIFKTIKKLSDKAMFEEDESVDDDEICRQLSLQAPRFGYSGAYSEVLHRWRDVSQSQSTDCILAEILSNDRRAEKS